MNVGFRCCAEGGTRGLAQIIESKWPCGDTHHLKHLPPMNHIYIPRLLAMNLEEGSALIALSLIFLAAIIVVSMQFFRNRDREMWHQTARLAIEKGQPVPPMPMPEPLSRPASYSGPRDIRSGLILIAVGAGLALFLGQQNAPRLGYVGAIPGFIGAALLFHGLIHTLTRKPTLLPDDHIKDA